MDNLEVTLNALGATLRDLEQHHQQLNDSKGRPRTHSHTLSLVGQAQTQLRAVERALRADQRPPDLYGLVRHFNAQVVGPEVDRTAHGLNTPPREELELALRLVLEEVQELVRACGYGLGLTHPGFDLTLGHRHDDTVDHVGAADGAADILYVLFGLLLRLGISRRQFVAVWYEVTRANLAKAGGPTREDGKRLKPPGWRPPNVAEALRTGEMLDSAVEAGAIMRGEIEPSRRFLLVPDGGGIPCCPACGQECEEPKPPHAG